MRARAGNEGTAPACTAARSLAAASARLGRRLDQLRRQPDDRDDQPRPARPGDAGDARMVVRPRLRDDEVRRTELAAVPGLAPAGPHRVRRDESRHRRRRRAWRTAAHHGGTWPRRRSADRHPRRRRADRHPGRDHLQAHARYVDHPAGERVHAVRRRHPLRHPPLHRRHHSARTPLPQPDGERTRLPGTEARRLDPSPHRGDRQPGELPPRPTSSATAPTTSPNSPGVTPPGRRRSRSRCRRGRGR